MKTLKLISIILLFVSNIYSQKIYTDTSCGFTVAIPKDWTVKELAPEVSWYNCEIGLSYPGWKKEIPDTTFDVNDYALHISVYNGSLTDDQSGIEFKDSTWWIVGRAGAKNEGAFVQTKNWDAVIGESEVGAYLKQGGYFGSARALLAVLDNRKGKVLIIFADSMFQDKTIFDSIVFSTIF